MNQSLWKPSERKKRESMLREAHVFKLTKLVENIRKRENLCGDYIPYFDPMDGGIKAKALFVLEAPGREAVKSGFISQDNPDKTARNMSCFLKRANIQRNEVILWNIVPWYVGSEEKISEPKPQDIDKGGAYLLELIQELSDLKNIVLVGKKAQKAGGILKLIKGIQIFDSYHPSPRNQRYKNKIQKVFCDVFKHLR